VSRPGVLFLGGNGHAPVRLEPARRALAERGEPFELRDCPYPLGSSFEGMLDELEVAIDAWHTEHDTRLVYATGIGALVALALRARGALLDTDVVLQGGVLWGLEQRWFPRLMRLGPMPRLLAVALRLPATRRRFVTKHFEHAPEPAFQRAFFDGYDDADAFATWFGWLTPALLRRLEHELPARPGALERLEAWWGGRDRVVSLEELRVTERALGVTLPVRDFAAWGHYPMIDDPDGWVEELARAVAPAVELR
jgi:hypothetical protein